MAAVSESSAAISESSSAAEDKVSDSLLPTEDKGESKSSVPGERSLHLSAELEGLKFTLSDSSGDLLSSNLKSKYVGDQEAGSCITQYLCLGHFGV